MRFIVKGGNMKEIVMSSEFEELPKSLIIEVMRSSLTQPTIGIPASSSSNQLTDVPEGSIINIVNIKIPENYRFLGVIICFL